MGIALAAAPNPATFDRGCSLRVHPMWARRGLARHLMARAEAEASAAGHGEIALAAPLSGQPLCIKLRFEAGRDITVPLPNAHGMRLVSMRKNLARELAFCNAQIERPKVAEIIRTCPACRGAIFGGCLPPTQIAIGKGRRRR